MKKIDKFTKGEMNDSEEEKYFESLYEKHYDNKLKSHYEEKLAQLNNPNTDKEAKDNISSRNKNTITKYFYLGSALVAALLIFVLVVLPIINNSSITSNQYAQSLITIEKIDIKRGQEEPQIRLDLIKAFNNGEYDIALSMYSKLDPMTSEDYYFKGRILLYQKKYEDAINTFNLISDPETFKFNVELNYWLAIAYASNGDNASAKPLLNNVTKSNWMTKEAQELLGKMK